MSAGDIPISPVLGTSTIPPVNRLLIRQGGAADLGGVLRVCETHAEYWDAQLPSEMRLSAFFERALGRTLATHAIRHAARTPLQYLFARVPTRDSLLIGVLASVGYEEVGVIPPSDKEPRRPERIELVYVVDG